MLNQSFVNGKMSGRLLEPLKEGDLVVLGIPGGPGVTGRYMDDITVAAAKSIGANALIIDLPNHDSSYGKTGRAIEYPEVHELFTKLISELKAKKVKIALFAHSLGSLIALDLLRTKLGSFERAVLMCTPSSLDSSPEFEQFKFHAGADEPDLSNEEGFKAWWKKILPAYFYRKPNEETVKLISDRTFWIGNENFMTGMQAGTEMAHEVNRLLKGSEKIIYLEGEKEWILPAKNFERVKSALPDIKHYKLRATGHFPMLEDSAAVLNIVTPFLNRCNSALASKKADQGEGK